MDKKSVMASFMFENFLSNIKFPLESIIIHSKAQFLKDNHFGIPRFPHLHFLSVWVSLMFALGQVRKFSVMMTQVWHDRLHNYVAPVADMDHAESWKG